MASGERMGKAGRAGSRFQEGPESGTCRGQSHRWPL